MRLLRRMPAVSTNRIGPSSVSTTVSMLSLVVPGTSWTTDRSSPMRRLKSVDLPTFGRPTMATAGTSGWTGSGAAATASASSGGRASTTASRRSPTWRRPTRRLTRVDFPTLGRPTTATTGLGISDAEGAPKGEAVGGHDLHRPRQVSGRRAVEERAARETNVGEEVPVPLGLLAQDA